MKTSKRKRPQPTGLTLIRLKILTAIQHHQIDTRLTPTYREIADAVGLKSIGSLTKHLRRLEADGYLKIGKGPRMIELTERGQNV